MEDFEANGKLDVGSFLYGFVSALGLITGIYVAILMLQ